MPTDCNQILTHENILGKHTPKALTRVSHGLIDSTDLARPDYNPNTRQHLKPQSAFCTQSCLSLIVVSLVSRLAAHAEINNIIKRPIDATSWGWREIYGT